MIDSKNKKRSIMALHNPSSRENHISKMFADDLGLPISNPPDVPYVQVSWSSSNLQRYNETTIFMVAGPASFKLLFGREDGVSQYEASSKHHSLGGKDKMGRSKPIPFKEGIKIGLLYKVELDDSDGSEAEKVHRGPKLADVEARLQSDYTLSLSPLEKYVKEHGYAEPAIGKTLFLADNDVISAKSDRTPGSDAENWTHTSPRKGMLPTSSASTSAIPVYTNPFAVLAGPSLSSSKKKKRKGSSKKSSQNLEQEVDTQRLVPGRNLPVTDMGSTLPSAYTASFCGRGSNLSLPSSQPLDSTNSHEASSESGRSNINYTTQKSCLTFAGEQFFSRYPALPSKYDETRYNGNKERIPRSSKTFTSKFEKDPETTLQLKQPKSSAWVQREHSGLVDNASGRQKRKTGSKRQKS